MFITTHAIVLQSLPFQEHNRIAKLFTKELGLVSVFIKSSAKNPPSWAIALTEIELLLEKSKGELFKAKDLSFIDAHLSLRENNKQLFAAIEIIKCISSTQLPEKPAPLLFDLLLSLLKALEKGSDTATTVALFRLKILLHEGLIDFPLPQELNSFNSEEQVVLENLSTTRSTTQLFKNQVSPSLEIKLKHLFNGSFET